MRRLGLYSLFSITLFVSSPPALSQSGCSETEDTRRLEELAAGGNEFAQRVLGQQTAGERSYRGSPEELADSKALEVVRKLAAQGIAESQATLGWFYYNGRGGLSKDRAEALKWYRKAAEQGNAEAQASLGSMHADGICVPKNDAVAIAWYREAANNGNAIGQHNLGVAFLHGKGVAIDKTEAARWFLAAADQGFAPAQYNIGTMYATGNGVPTSQTEAYFWLNLAAAQGHPSAKENRDFAAREMSREEIAEAQRRSIAWRPRGKN